MVIGGGQRHHSVQLYRDEAELAEAVGSYLGSAVDAGDPCLVVATPQHDARFAEALGSRTPEERALLTSADAEQTLAALMADGEPSGDRFEAVVGGLLDSIAAAHPGRHIRVFGEMVDLLCQRGKCTAAVALERLWNELQRKRPFSLLCAYELDVFDRAAQTGPLPEVCREHTRVHAAADPARLTRAVDRALEEVLGADQAGKVYLLVGEEARRGRIPIAQLALMWVSENMPALADRVLAAARSQYGHALPAIA
jgi:hypothetical protein